MKNPEIKNVNIEKEDRNIEMFKERLENLYKKYRLDPNERMDEFIDSKIKSTQVGEKEWEQFKLGLVRSLIEEYSDGGVQYDEVDEALKSWETEDIEVETQKEISNKEDLTSEIFDFKKYHDSLEDGHMKEALKGVFDLARRIKEKGGRALLVGGSVRDLYFGKNPKDYDLEIYGLESDEIEEVCKKFGKVADVGKAFGILKVNLGNFDLDVSLPRTDSKIGEGHRGFAVKTDPHMSISEAAKRRDFTFNALAADPLTGEIFDYYGGLDDIKNRTLRITDPERFKDDPLRVMRALQFISRFGLKIDPETKEILKEMIPLLKELPKERILEEWKKMLVKGDKPSFGLMAGMDLGIFHELYPDFPPLAQTEQEPEWHPEGDAWIHSLLVVDEAKKICKVYGLDEGETFNIMLASLCHDLGKVETTQVIDGKITSRGHDKAGKYPSERFLEELGVDNITKDKVLSLVVNHMAPSLLYLSELKGDKISDGAIRSLAQRTFPATIQELVLVAMADHLGRGYLKEDSFEPLAIDYPAGEWLINRANKLEINSNKPKKMISGKDLIESGFQKPKTSEEGMKFGKLIILGDKLRDLSELLVLEIEDQEKIDKEQYLNLIKEIDNLDEAIDKVKNRGIEIVDKIRKKRNSDKSS